MSDVSTESQRLDIWLWRARFFKTRALATALITKRGVRISRHGQVRRVNKPGVSVMLGDVLTFSKAKRVQVIEVVGFGTRRGPASEAQMLYLDRTDQDSAGAAGV